MPYSVGAHGSNGCSGFPVVDDSGKTVGCHPTKEQAVNHMQALYANVPDASKANCCQDLEKQSPCWYGYVQRGMKEQDGKMVPNCIPVNKAETPMDVAYNPIVTDPEPATPSSHINPSVGMKKPQYMLNFGRQVGPGIHDKRVVEIWRVKSENAILPTNTYQECQGNTCTCTDKSCKNK